MMNQSLPTEHNKHRELYVTLTPNEYFLRFKKDKSKSYQNS